MFFDRAVSRFYYFTVLKNIEQFSVRLRFSLKRSIRNYIIICYIMCLHLEESVQTTVVINVCGFVSFSLGNRRTYRFADIDREHMECLSVRDCSVNTHNKTFKWNKKCLQDVVV